MAGLAARELDRLAGKTPGHVGLIEARPESDVMAGTVLVYAEVLGVSLDWLIAGKGDEPQQETVIAAAKAARARARADSAKPKARPAKAARAARARPAKAARARVAA